jgi:hypothetical protein
MRLAKFLWAAVAVLLLSNGCESSDLEGLFTVSCDRGINEFYDKNCAMNSSSSLFAVSKSDALTKCKKWEAEADKRGCKKELESLLLCMNNIDENKCDSCSDEFAAKNACWSGIDDTGSDSDCLLYSEYKCYDGTCIPIADRCNGIFNCTFGEDEMNCD